MTITTNSKILTTTRPLSDNKHADEKSVLLVTLFYHKIKAVALSHATVEACKPLTSFLFTCRAHVPE